MNGLFLMFLEFFKTGLFSVGGGLATLPFLYDLADKYDWFTKSQLADMLAVSESTPGPIGVNMATYAGFSAHGVAGAVVATLGLVLPSIIVIIVVAGFLKKWRGNRIVDGLFYGLRPAVAALIALACLEVFKIAIVDFSAFSGISSIPAMFSLPSLLLFAAILFINVKWKPHPILLIALGAAAGIVFKF